MPCVLARGEAVQPPSSVLRVRVAARSGTCLGTMGAPSADRGHVASRAVTAARQSLGRRGEEIAVRHLRELGYAIVQRNARTRYGELDIVARQGTTLVFVEVKAGRAGAATGPERPALAVGPRKRVRIRRLAREWLAEQGRPRYEAVRFDVIGVTLAGSGRIDALEHIENAL